MLKRNFVFHFLECKLQERRRTNETIIIFFCRKISTVLLFTSCENWVHSFWMQTHKTMMALKCIQFFFALLWNFCILYIEIVFKWWNFLQNGRKCEKFFLFYFFETIIKRQQHCILWIFMLLVYANIFCFHYAEGFLRENGLSIVLLIFLKRYFERLLIQTGSKIVFGTFYVRIERF